MNDTTKLRIVRLVLRDLEQYIRCPEAVDSDVDFMDSDGIDGRIIVELSYTGESDDATLTVDPRGPLVTASLRFRSCEMDVDGDDFARYCAFVAAVRRAQRTLGVLRKNAERGSYVPTSTCLPEDLDSPRGRQLVKEVAVEVRRGVLRGDPVSLQDYYTERCEVPGPDAARYAYATLHYLAAKGA